ncbi:hypothetical protein GLOIN_2v1695656 [Rhizophagus clarus]|uniref:Crinkler effector protein N-terminal domain-containing protein n=1 Tax=Rhizophagus clarus TaxID=94130 RepID=A0A8H3QZK4_9GLOM|nr:hypothetical protein GLOIN_2v1695656 [Rhizophagus clarus]
MNNLQDYHGDINTIQIESKYNFYKMPERNITCFLQGVEEEFRVDVDGLETIKDLKNLIACQKTKFIRGINVDEYKIWEIRSNDDIIRLKDNPAERKDSTALNEYQRILGLFGENLDENHIWVFMGKPHTEAELMKEIIKDMAGHVRELEKTIRDLTDKIQSVTVNDSSVVNETDTIEDLKQLISYRMRKAISEKNIVINEFKIWKVSIPVDEADILQKDTSELKGGELLEENQNVTSIGKVLNNYIQVFMGNPNSVIIPPNLEKVVQNMGERIRELENKIQDLINETRDERLDEDADEELHAIRVGDVFLIDKEYTNTKIKKKKPVKISCRVVSIGNTGRLKVALLGGEQKAVSSLLTLEKWLLDCAGLSILYRNKDDTHLRRYLKVIRGEGRKSFKEIHEDYINDR